MNGHKHSLFSAFFCTLVLLNALLATSTASGQAIELTLSNPTGSTALFGTTAGNLLNDVFTYDPNLPFEFPGSLPAANLPTTSFVPAPGSNAFISGDSLRTWQADVALGGNSLDFIDLWGRTDGGIGEDVRHQSLTLEFFSGPNGTGSTLGVSGLFDVSDQTLLLTGSAYARFDVSSVLSDTQRSQVGSFQISQSAAAADFLLLQEVRAGSGEPDSPIPTAFVDRDTGNVSIVNGSVSTEFVGYSIASAFGALDASQWDSISNGATNTALDGDAWIEVSTAVGGGVNLSEAELPGGSGGTTLAPEQAVDLGPIWTPVSQEDVAITLISEDGTTVTPPVIFTGNGDAPFLDGDLNFDNAVDLADWALFRSGFGGVFPDQTGGQTYAVGDLNGDLTVDATDFRAFEAVFDAANGTSLAAALAAASVPEPASFSCCLMGLLAVATRRLRPRAQRGPRPLKPTAVLGLLAILGAAALPRHASAQTFTIIPAPANPATDVTESAAFGPMFVAANLFDSTTITEADIDTLNLAGIDGEFANLGQEPVSVFIDNNSSITTNWIAFAQRTGDVDFVGGVEVWVSDTDFGGVLPDRDADAVADFPNPTVPDASVLSSFPLSSTVSGQFTALRFSRAPSGTANIGGREFRFLQGPDQFTLEVNTATGEISITNGGSFAQSLDIDAYDISSPAGSLTTNGFTGLAGAAGFPAASGPDLGDGWELGEGSGSNLLAEAFLFQSSAVAPNADVSLGAGYDTNIDAQDLTFTYSLEDGVQLTGNVVYITPPGVTGDYNDDGAVDVLDYLAFRDNAGADSSVLANNPIPGAVGIPHFDQFVNQFGATAGGALAAVAVPEPTSSMLGLSLIGVAMLSLRNRRSHCTRPRCLTTNKGRMIVDRQKRVFYLSAVPIASLVLIASVASASTPDRLYLLGDDSNEAPAGPVNELGASNIGNVIGSQTGTTFDGFTLDHAGDPADFDTFTDLAPTGNPVYVDVGSNGLARPGAGAVSVGADFDGNDFLSTTLGFGNPSEGDNDFEATINYAGLINHYQQGWARPTSAGSSGQRQTLIRDTRQFAIHIDTTEQGVPVWGQVYADSPQTTDTPVVLNEWAHVAQFSNGDRAIFWVNGVIAGVLDGAFQRNGGTAGDRSFSLGAELTGTNLTPANFFTGQLDDFSVEVSGDNTGVPGGGDFGAFTFEVDNDFVAGLVADGQLVAGDVNGDLMVNGDGTGDPSEDDVSFFIDNYLQQQVINFEVVGDLNSRTQIGDLNYSGETNLFDWLILLENHQDATVAASLNLNELLAAASIPEPASAVLGALLLTLSCIRRRDLGNKC